MADNDTAGTDEGHERITAELRTTYAVRMDEPKPFHAAVLRAVDADMTYAEIGEAIGIPRARVFDLVARARQLQR